MKKNYLLLLLYSCISYSQCPYPTANTQLGTIRTLCVGTDRATTTNLSINNVNSTNYVTFNVVQGFSYRFIIAANVYAADNENLNIYDFATNSPLANISGASGVTLNWTATFSGQIKVILSQGSCNQTNTTSTTLLAHVISVGNTLDSQTTFGNNTWVGHVYDWVGSPPPGGASPATPSVTTPFTSAEYVGNFTIPTQNFVQGYGGDNVCFPVNSNGVNRTNILTDTYAVRYRMNSTLPAGCYILTIRGDDGIRVYVDNLLVFNSWIQQSPTVYNNVLVYLDGNADVIFDHYENNGENVADISIAPYDNASNTIATPTPSVVCSGVTPPQLNATSYIYNGGSVNPTINYQWQVSTDNVTFTNISGANSEDYTPPAIVTGTTQIRYYRRIVSAAANAAACNFASNSVQITTSGTTALAPTSTTGTTITCTSFFANWNVVSGATSYTLDVSTSSSFSTFVTGYNNTNVGTVTTRQITGLTASTTYYYRVRAIFSCGSSTSSNVITVTTQTLVTTPNTTVTGNGCGQFTINWTAIPNATNYQLDISTVSNFATFITGYNNLNIGNITSFTTGLFTDATVYFRLRTVGPCGTSANSSTTAVNVDTTTWNGTTWSNNEPSLTTLTVINGLYKTVTNGNLNSCRIIITSTGNLLVAPNSFVTIQNEIQNNGTVSIETEGSLVQINNSSVNTGNITVQKTANNVVSGQDYVYWSAPVNGQNLGSLFSASPFRYRWATTATNANGGEGTWINYSGAMNIGSGYIVRDVATVNFTGVPNNGIITVPIFRGNNYTGNGSQSIPRSITDDNWNLLGNPYPSAIGVNEFLSANTNIEGFIKIWTHGTSPTSTISPFYQAFTSNYFVNDYLTVNATGVTSGPADYQIASGQGFMTLMTAGPAGSGNITFNNNMRSKAFANNNFYRSTNAETPSNNRIWLDLKSASQTNRMLVGYVENATNDLDRMFDAFTDYTPSQNFYSIINNEPHIIQGRALPMDISDIVPIGFKASESGSHTIAIAAVDGLFSNNGQAIYLEDKELNIVHNLSLNPYNFTSTTGIHNERFEIRYTDRVLNTNDFDLVTNAVTIYATSNDIKINSTLSNIKSYEVFNVLGQSLASENKINSNQYIINNVAKTNQTLLVKATLENGQTITRKIIF